HRHLVNRAVAEIDELLGLADRELGSEAIAGVAGVSGRRGVAPLHRVGHLRIAELTRPDTIANADELAVPTISREPDFDLDVRIACGGQRRLDAAELRHVPVRRVGYAGWQVAGETRLLESTGGHAGSGRDLTVRQRQAREFAALGRCGGR